jgi:NUMOD4 motif
MSLKEVWSEIPGFEHYVVSNEGRVYNQYLQREMILSPTQNGELTVGLTVRGQQSRRSVKVLVAEAFVNGKDDLCNTPIQKDMNRENLNASNLEWRPRWFAWKYRRQFEDIPHWVYTGPVQDTTTKEEYEHILEAATTLGILFSDIRLSIYNATPVFPVGSVFAYKY